MKHLVSIIIPVYNVEKYLAQCVDSVLGQTYSETEIILVDDGSTDSSGKICDGYALNDKRIKVIHKENGGLSSARNAGFDVCTGEYVILLDSDDYYTPNAVEKLLKNATDNGSELVFFNAHSFADDGYEKPVTQGYGHKLDYKADSGENMAKALLDNKDFRYASCLLFIKRELLTRSGIRFIEGIINEDMTFTFEIMVTAKTVSYENSALYERRVRNGSITTTKKTELSYKSSLAIYYDLYGFYKKAAGKSKTVTEKYISQNVVRVFNKYKQLDKEKRAEYKNTQLEFKEHVLKNGSYGDKALKFKCENELLWLCYKLKNKIFGR